MINDVRFHKHSYTAFFETIHMMMTIDRPTLLNRLIQAKSHHLIKIITGIRRCGESYLLFRLFKDHLRSSGINPRNIIEINLEHPDFHAFRNALALRDLIDKRMKAIRGECFILIDEIQLARKILPPDIDLATRFRAKTSSHRKRTPCDISTTGSGESSSMPTSTARLTWMTTASPSWGSSLSSSTRSRSRRCSRSSASLTHQLLRRNGEMPRNIAENWSDRRDLNS